MKHKLSGAGSIAILATVLILKPGLAEEVPQFEQYPVKHTYKKRPVPPLITPPGEIKNRVVIEEGVEKGWGVFDGTTGVELQRPGVNFAGHYILVSFGCGDSYSTLLCVAIVDAKTGHIFKQPLPEFMAPPAPFEVATIGLPPHPYSSFHNFKFKSPIAYRLNSRLVIVKLCEGMHFEELGCDVNTGVFDHCGDHYYRMDEDGLRLIYRVDH